MIGSSSMIRTRVAVWRSISASASATRLATSLGRRVDQIAGVVVGEPLHRRQQQRLTRQRRDRGEPVARDLFERRGVGRFGRDIDVGRRPDRVERLVQAEPGVDVAGKIAGGLDDRLERGADECVTMTLASGQRPGVAAQVWKMRRNFGSKRHEFTFVRPASVKRVPTADLDCLRRNEQRCGFLVPDVNGCAYR